LACTIDSEERLACIHFVGAELARGTQRGNIGADSVAKGKGILSAASEKTGAVCGAISDRIAIGEELECAGLQTIVVRGAVVTFVLAASVNERVRGKENECEREHDRKSKD
jgi:hypothetical protein